MEKHDIEIQIKKSINSDFETNLFLKLKEFTTFITFKSKISNFDSFSKNLFINNNENYKKEIWDIANEKLNALKFYTSFGSGALLSKLIECIEIPGNNLLQWDARNGPESRVHAKLFEIIETKKNLKELEESLWKFYFSEEISEQEFFNRFIEIVNKKYSLVAYLFFIKDKSKYLPLATNTFDDFFRETEIDLRTSKKCSWGNYYSYISVMDYIRSFLRENLDSDATLIDAHSFVWILERQYKEALKKGTFKKPKEFQIKEKDKETIIKARIGQGRYRELLKQKWNDTESISDYANPDFMRASHIKPWKNCDNKECIDPENGLLLKPDNDFLFDQGYISFKDDGSIIISKMLSEQDIQEFHLSEEIRIKQVTPKMKEYLNYHRENVFKK